MSTIYHHFRNKEEILDEIVKLFQQRIQRRMSDERLRKLAHTVPLEGFLRMFFFSYRGEEYGELMYLHRILFMEQYRDARFQQIFVQYVGAAVGLLQGVFDMLVEEKIVRPFDTLNVARVWSYSNVVEAMKACQDLDVIHEAAAHPETFEMQRHAADRVRICIEMVTQHRIGQKKDNRR